MSKGVKLSSSILLSLREKSDASVCALALRIFEKGAGRQYHVMRFKVLPTRRKKLSRTRSIDHDSAQNPLVLTEEEQQSRPDDVKLYRS